MLLMNQMAMNILANLMTGHHDVCTVVSLHFFYKVLAGKVLMNCALFVENFPPPIFSHPWYIND